MACLAEKVGRRAKPHQFRHRAAILHLKRDDSQKVSLAMQYSQAALRSAVGRDGRWRLCVALGAIWSNRFPSQS
jgi:hypothetical protein